MHNLCVKYLAINIIRVLALFSFYLLSLFHQLSPPFDLIQIRFLISEQWGRTRITANYKFAQQNILIVSDLQICDAE